MAAAAVGHNHHMAADLGQGKQVENMGLLEVVVHIASQGDIQGTEPVLHKVAAQLPDLEGNLQYLMYTKCFSYLIYNLVRV